MFVDTNRADIRVSGKSIIEIRNIPKTKKVANSIFSTTESQSNMSDLRLP